MAAGRVVAYSRANETTSSRGMPVSDSTRSGGYSRARPASASNPLV